MRTVLVIVAIGAVAAIGWLVFEVRALRSPPPSPPLAAAPAPQAPPPAPPPSPAPSPAPLRPAASHARAKLQLDESATPEPPSLAAQAPDTSPAAVALARVRVESVLAAVTRVCTLPRDADRRQHLVVRVTAGGDRVQSLEHVDGALPDEVTACIDKRLRAARWPPVATPLTFDLPVRAGDLIE